MSDVFISSLLKNFFKIMFSLIILSFFFYIIYPFLVPIILGGIMALALCPFVDYFVRRGFKRNTSVMIFTLLSSLAGLIPVVAFLIHGTRVITKILHESQIKAFTEKLSVSSYELIDQLSVFYGLNQEMIRTKFATLVVHLSNSIVNSFHTFLSEIPTILMMGAISSLSVYCFLRESDKIRALFDRYFYFNKSNGNKFILMFKVCCREVFFSNIISGVLQASIVSIGALIFGVGDFFIVFSITFIFSFIPVIGAAPVSVVIGTICLLESRIGPGVSMMVVAMVAGISDNIIRPFLGSIGEVNVHPLIGFMAVVGGVMMFGLPGLFIGPLVVTLSFGALPIIIEEYFPKIAVKMGETLPKQAA